MKKLYQGRCEKVMKSFNSNIIDLTVTSPPYDDLRDYEGYEFDFESVANELYRITKPGGIVVWIVGDQVINGSESGNSFRQALYFKKIGFNIHDTMIYQKCGVSNPSKNRYYQIFEYMFIFSKGKPNVFNPIKDRKNKYKKYNVHGKQRLKNGKMCERSNRLKNKIIQDFGVRYNIWKIAHRPAAGSIQSKIHPATFPYKLAYDHIKSWSNEGDLVLDPMAGSGTSLLAAKILKRKYVGIELSKKYIELIKIVLNEEISNIQDYLTPEMNDYYEKWLL